MDPTAIADDIRTVLADYGLTSLGDPEPVSSGSLNWNFRVETSAGPMFVRKHRADRRIANVRAEHALVEWMAERGLPVVPALPGLDGDTVCLVADSVWAVFPWVEGRPPVRPAITAAQAHAVGEMHGRIHAVLSAHPLSA